MASLGSEKGFVALEERKLSAMLECSSQHLQLKQLLLVSTIRRLIILAGQVDRFPFTTAITFWKSQVFGCGFVLLSFALVLYGWNPSHTFSVPGTVMAILQGLSRDEERGKKGRQKER